MRFVELGEHDATQVANWLPGQNDLAEAVMAALRAYIKSLEALTQGRYQHLRDKLPPYLADPGNVVAVICKDGVVVRYERKHGDQKPKIGVAGVPEGVELAAMMLSQNLVHIATETSPMPPENFGVSLTLSANSPESSHDFLDSRIWFQTKMPTEPPSPLACAKPYCLLSVRNHMALELHGEILSSSDPEGPKQPFIARSTFRLQAGWDCIEVFIDTDLERWNAERSPLWAEYDILGAALISQTTEAHLISLDPRAATRRLYAAVLHEYKALLDSSPEREQVLQAFLQQHPYLLCPSHTRMWPKLPLGNTVTDFVFLDAQKQYLLVEIERSDRLLFRRDGQPTAELTHAQNQVFDWKRYIEDNLATVQRELGLDGITSNPDALVVIGRSASLDETDHRKLQIMASQSPKLKVITYDDVYANAKAVLENLLGPIWDAGGSTEIYYPVSAPGLERKP
jgi:hypothetical protein